MLPTLEKARGARRHGQKPDSHRNTAAALLAGEPAIALAEPELEEQALVERRPDAEPQPLPSLEPVKQSSWEKEEPDPPTGKRPIYRRRWVWAVGAVVLAAGLGYGTRSVMHAMAYETTDDAFIAAHTVRVSPRVAGHVQEVFVTDNQLVEKGQKLLELDPTDYQSQVNEAQAALNAALARRDAAETHIKLIEVTSSATATGAQSSVAEAESGVQTARASVEVARSKVAQAQADVASAQASAAQTRAELVAAEADVTRADTELARLTGLAANVVSQQEIINARAAAQVAQAKRSAGRTRITAADAQITQAQAALDTARQGVIEAQSRQKAAEAQLQQARAELTGADVSPQRIAVAKSEYANANAEVARLQAQLAQARQNENDTLVYAPAAGRITRKNVEPGSYLEVGQTVLALVPREMWVTANFKETQLEDIRPGQPAEITVDAYPHLALHGHVDSIQRGAGAAFSLLPPENATGNYVKVVQRVPVKIVLDELPDANHPIGPGMSVAPEVKVR
jgi:membrane fusion protein (multidrug efflux system)